MPLGSLSEQIWTNPLEEETLPAGSALWAQSTPGSEQLGTKQSKPNEKPHLGKKIMHKFPGISLKIILRCMWLTLGHTQPLQLGSS